MNVKYYNFESPIGEMTICFSEKGIVYLNLLDEDDIFRKKIWTSCKGRY